VSELTSRGIIPVAPGGNEWSYDADAIKGVDEYVHLCLFDSHPMEYRAKQDGRILISIFLEVSTDVLFIPEVVITDDVANKRGVELLDFESAADRLDWPIITQRLDWNDPDVKERRKVAKKYEVLVPDAIPTHLIRGL
jgi:hypothetical protein